MRLDHLCELFLQAGYDMPTISRMTPEVLFSLSSHVNLLSSFFEPVISSYVVQEILLDREQSNVLLARIIFSCILLSAFFVPFDLY